jgi:glycerol-3-phosphate dehydrogenase
MSLDALASTELDLLVVGAGIHGAFAAWEAARRGLRVGLIDRGDFGGAASANSLKIVHGGFRYLQTGDVGRLRASHAARAALLRLAPELVHPLPCVVPASSALTRSPLALGAALSLYELLSLGIGEARDASPSVPRGRVVGREEYAQLAGPLTVADASGAALWYDALLTNPDRLLLSIVLATAREGGMVANYVDAVELLRERHGARDRVSGARVRSEHGAEAEVRARVTLLAASAGARALAPGGATALPPFARACNLVLDASRFALPQAAVAIPVAGQRRMLFAVPWRGRLMLGTSQHEGDAADASARAVEELLGAVNRAVPELALTDADVRLVHQGVLPGTPTALLDRPVLTDHEARDGVSGVVTMVGVKWTTAIQAASRAVALCVRQLGGARAPTRAHLPEADDARVAVARVARESPDLAAPLAEGVLTTGADVAHAIRHEMARHLDDVVMRRTELGGAGDPGDAVLRAAARIAGRELGWDAARERDELLAVRRRFPGR